jgi:hypothetical protein
MSADHQIYHAVRQLSSSVCLDGNAQSCSKCISRKQNYSNVPWKHLLFGTQSHLVSDVNTLGEGQFYRVQMRCMLCFTGGASVLKAFDQNPSHSERSSEQAGDWNRH